MSDRPTAPADRENAPGTRQPCRVCGADARPGSDLCATCAGVVGTAGAAPDGPLSPLPDGGLAGTMPAWLRRPRHTGDDQRPQAPAMSTGLDVSAILTDDDLPEWLKRIAERQGRGQAFAVGSSPDATDAADTSARPAPLPEAADLPPPAGTGPSLPPLPSSLIRPAPARPDPPPAPAGEVRERLIAAAMAIVALIILVLIFLL